MGAAPSHTRPCVRHLISHAWGFRSFPVTAPLAWAACQLQHLPRYPSLIRTAQACPPGLPTRSRRTPFPAVAAHSNRSLLGAVSVARKRNFEARGKGAEMAVGIHLAAETTHQQASPTIRGFSPKAGKSPLDADCVVGLGGLKLRAKHAVVSNESPTRPLTAITCRSTDLRPTVQPHWQNTLQLRHTAAG
jgi:hypothetical protein